MMNSLLSSQLYDNTNFYKSFEKDVKSAQRSVLIESPFITTRRMNALLPIFRTLRQRGVQIVINTRNPEEHDEEYTYQARLAIYKMQELGITVLYTVKHHRKLAIIDKEILWEGSLNILSQNDSCEIMRRTESEGLARQMIEFVNVERYLLDS
jgi:phosphatidylserine/phosphatidylglycerophosphate/cardiolipin synthase-like enzyme